MYILITQVKSFSKNNTCAFLHRLSKHWTYMLSGMSSPLDRQRYETSLPAWSKLARLKCVLSLCDWWIFIIYCYLLFCVLTPFLSCRIFFCLSLWSVYLFTLVWYLFVVNVNLLFFPFAVNFYWFVTFCLISCSFLWISTCLWSYGCFWSHWFLLTVS